MIFYAWCALDAAANVNSVWRNPGDGVPDVLRVQTTRENEKSRERKRCSCRRPIAGQSRTAAQFRMMRIQKHVAIGKRAGVFGLEPAIGRKSSNDAEFTRQFATCFSRKISVQLNGFDT